MHRIIGLGLFFFAPLALATPGPSFVHGAVMSGLLGPTGYSLGGRGPELSVQRISADLELLPDLAVMELTWTVHNDGDAITTTVGIRQDHKRLDEHSAVFAQLPLDAVAFVDRAALREDGVNISRVAGGGYELGVTTVFPAGDTELTLRVAFQSVASLVVDGAQQPSGAGDGRAGLSLSTNGGGWDGSELVPTTTVRIRTGPGVELSQVTAEAWTDGAKEAERAIWWERPPDFVVRYVPEGTAARAATRDDLRAAAAEALSGPPRGHLNLPEGAVGVLPPGAPQAPAWVADVRMRRALLVPAVGLALLLLLGYGYARIRASSGSRRDSLRMNRI